jgi:hypothetical protein
MVTVIMVVEVVCIPPSRIRKEPEKYLKYFPARDAGGNSSTGIMWKLKIAFSEDVNPDNLSLHN